MERKRHRESGRKEDDAGRGGRKGKQEETRETKKGRKGILDF